MVYPESSKYVEFWGWVELNGALRSSLRARETNKLLVLKRFKNCAWIVPFFGLQLSVI